MRTSYPKLPVMHLAWFTCPLPALAAPYLSVSVGLWLSLRSASRSASSSQDRRGVRQVPASGPGGIWGYHCARALSSQYVAIRGVFSALVHSLTTRRSCRDQSRSPGSVLTT
ncbi:hypothetical protein DB88DRAFT_128138 [Papiliotrema laurentii]|uniref:Secreted protein n=1 Tax=Papiliotrema laurentii TaxID=5418 RepID=A0AAD9CX59_PAPLA|nr:hypothetical protein DB88DRAFT_128138 [Papiliotrema laurentii]